MNVAGFQEIPVLCTSFCCLKMDKLMSVDNQSTQLSKENTGCSQDALNGPLVRQALTVRPITAQTSVYAIEEARVEELKSHLSCGIHPVDSITISQSGLKTRLPSF